MVGPPGTGKTLLARAVAGEADVPFFSVTGSSFVEMFVGVGAARVRDLFAEARKRAPAIIFIDEIDAIGQRRAGSGAVVAADFDEARDRILLGRREGSNVLLPEEKHAVAVHESGHALVAALSEHADPVAKVTILPAGQALGVTEQLPLVERHLYGEDYLHDSLAVRLGGRAAELVELGQGSTGAANDLAGATDLATRMVREFGLSTALGPVGYPRGGSVFLGGDGGGGFSSRPFAEQTQATIDTEVSRLLRDAEERAVAMLRARIVQS
jgi:cell division protease FtsH